MPVPGVEGPSNFEEFGGKTRVVDQFTSYCASMGYKVVTWKTQRAQRGQRAADCQRFERALTGGGEGGNVEE
jgi:hypothetical protein